MALRPIVTLTPAAAANKTTEQLNRITKICNTNVTYVVSVGLLNDNKCVNI